MRVTQPSPQGQKEAKMTSEKMSAPAFSITGDIRFDARKLNNESAQILCFADVNDGHTQYPNLLILKLDIWGNSDDGYLVDDDYSKLIYYAKPVRSFRAYLIRQLRRLVREREYRVPDPVRSGVNAYIAELLKFSDARSLGVQVKDCVDQILRGMKQTPKIYTEQFVAHEMRKLLAIMGAKPKTDRKIEIKT